MEEGQQPCQVRERHSAHGDAAGEVAAAGAAVAGGHVGGWAQ